MSWNKNKLILKFYWIYKLIYYINQYDGKVDFFLDKWYYGKNIIEE